MSIKPHDIHLFENAQELCVQAACEIIRIGNEAIRQRGRFVIALSGGSTPERLYRTLATPRWSSQLDWSQCDLFWGDERAVPATDADSNYRMATQTLVQPLDLNPKRVHRMQAEREDLDAAARDYEREIAATFEIDMDREPPKFDLVLLGMGDDGHTASLFPGTTALQNQNRWVVANQVPQLSTQRMTMTAHLINRARHSMFLVQGRSKAERLADVLEGPYQPEVLPSQLIRPVDGTLQWLVDHEAARQLSNKST